jgi:hypothetical protein
MEIPCNTLPHGHLIRNILFLPIFVILSFCILFHNGLKMDHHNVLFLFHFSIVTTLLWESVRMRLTLPKWGLWSPPGLSKLQSSIIGAKHLAFKCSLHTGKLSKSRCRKWARMSHLDICNTNYGKKKGWESNWQFDFQPLKVKNRPELDACKWSAIHRWKVINESYKFALDLVPIGDMSSLAKLQESKPTQFRDSSLGRSLGIKSHLDVGATERHRKYYMGEGGGFLRVRAVVSLVNPESPVACPSTKSALESELTHLLVGLMQIRVSNKGLSLFLVPSRSFSTPLYPF